MFVVICHRRPLNDLATTYLRRRIRPPLYLAHLTHPKPSVRIMAAFCLRHACISAACGSDRITYITYMQPFFGRLLSSSRPILLHEARVAFGHLQLGYFTQAAFWTRSGRFGIPLRTPALDSRKRAMSSSQREPKRRVKNKSIPHRLRFQSSAFLNLHGLFCAWGNWGLPDKQSGWQVCAGAQEIQQNHFLCSLHTRRSTSQYSPLKS